MLRFFRLSPNAIIASSSWAATVVGKVKFVEYKLNGEKAADGCCIPKQFGSSEIRRPFAGNAAVFVRLYNEFEGIVAPRMPEIAMFAQFSGAVE
jgi:hypothetical protein